MDLNKARLALKPPSNLSLPKVSFTAIHSDGGNRNCFGRSLGKYSRKNSLLHDKMSSSSTSLIADCDELM